MGHKDALCSQIAYAASEHLKLSVRKIDFLCLTNQHNQTE